MSPALVLLEFWLNFPNIIYSIKWHLFFFSNISLFIFRTLLKEKNVYVNNVFGINQGIWFRMEHFNCGIRRKQHWQLVSSFDVGAYCFKWYAFSSYVFPLNLYFDSLQSMKWHIACFAINSMSYSRWKQVAITLFSNLIRETVAKNYHTAVYIDFTDHESVRVVYNSAKVKTGKNEKTTCSITKVYELCTIH
jgi:hypothetical protein